MLTIQNNKHDKKKDVLSPVNKVADHKITNENKHK